MNSASFLLASGLFGLGRYRILGAVEVGQFSFGRLKAFPVLAGFLLEKCDRFREAGGPPGAFPGRDSSVSSGPKLPSGDQEMHKKPV